MTDVRGPTLTLGFLVLATIATTWGLSKDDVAQHTALVLTFGLVAVKVALVMLEFMELRRAHPVGRLLFVAWAVAVPAVVVMLAW